MIMIVSSRKIDFFLSHRILKQERRNFANTLDGTSFTAGVYVLQPMKLTIHFKCGCRYSCSVCVINFSGLTKYYKLHQTSLKL